MDTFLEILKFTIPALIVFATTFVMVHKFIEKDILRRRHEAFLANQKLITPVRMQAYERLVLFLERISPNAIMIRTLHPKMTAKQLQHELLQTIRSEYEHNISQQIYISSEAWKITKSAKENLIKLINSIASVMKEDATGFDLSKAVLEAVMQQETSPVATAIDFLKNEMRQIFMK